MPLALIGDGYDFKGQVPAKFGNPPVTFRYRPALAEDVYEYIAAKGPGQFATASKLVAGHVISWDIVEKAGGEPVGVTPEAIKRVPHYVLDYIVDAVCGYTDRKADEKN